MCKSFNHDHKLTKLKELEAQIVQHNSTKTVIIFSVTTLNGRLQIVLVMHSPVKVSIFNIL